MFLVLMQAITTHTVRLVNPVSIFTKTRVVNPFIKQFNVTKRTHRNARTFTTTHFEDDPVWDDPNLPHIIKQNKKWSNEMKKEHPEFFEYNMTKHKPNILWIGCSDARIPASSIIGEPAGSVFVHRNIANMVVNTDINCMSVLQYAITVLKVRHIIVCGHYDCGGIKAALTNINNVSPLENWLRNIRDVHRLHHKELSSLPDKKAVERRLVELNVIEQCLNIFKTGVVQARRVETYEMKQKGDKSIKFLEPRVHPFVYEPTTGEAKKLDIDFIEVIKEYSMIYDLYSGKPDRFGGKPNKEMALGLTGPQAIDLLTDPDHPWPAI